LKILWTFGSQAKAELFGASLGEAGILFEILAKSGQKSTGAEAVISVDEENYERAKKILIKYRKRRTAT
jgi:hypothetical protein